MLKSIIPEFYFNCGSFFFFSSLWSCRLSFFRAFYFFCFWMHNTNNKGRCNWARADLDTRLEVHHGISYLSYGAPGMEADMDQKYSVVHSLFPEEKFLPVFCLLKHPKLVYSATLQQWNSVLTGRELIGFQHLWYRRVRAMFPFFDLTLLLSFTF